jgi:hypothetical protein
MAVFVRPTPPSQSPLPTVRQAFLGVAAAFALALLAAYELVVSTREPLGLAPALPLGLLAFVVVGAVALVAAAHLDARVLSRR